MASRALRYPCMGLPKSRENFAILALSFFPFLSWVHPFVRPQATIPSSRPAAGRAPRAGAVQDAALAAPATPARSVLDSFEHGASLAAGRDDIACHMDPVVRQAG